MSVSTIQGANQGVVFAGTLISSVAQKNFFEGTEANAPPFSVDSHVTSGTISESLGANGSGILRWRKDANVSRFRAGRSYIQEAVVQSGIAPFAAYSKTTATLAPLSVDPSLDAINWTPTAGTAGPSLTATGSILVESLGVSGSAPANILWLGDGAVAAAVLSGRVANNPGSDAALRVNGLISCEGFQITNVNRLPAQATIGTATLVAGTSGPIANTSCGVGSTVLTQRVSASAATDGALTSIAGLNTFTIDSNNAGDVSQVRWIILDPVQIT